MLTAAFMGIWHKTIARHASDRLWFAHVATIVAYCVIATATHDARESRNRLANALDISVLSSDVSNVQCNEEAGVQQSGNRKMFLVADADHRQVVMNLIDN